MPKLNIDELRAKREPIEFTLGGKNHVVKNFTNAAMKAVADVQKRHEAKEIDEEQAATQTLEIFTGDPAEDFAGFDMRDLGAASRFIQESLEAETAAATASKNLKPGSVSGTTGPASPKAV